MSHKPCQSVSLVQNPICHIEYCSCGKVHLHLGAFSVRFTEEAFAELSASFQDGLACMERLTLEHETRAGMEQSARRERAAGYKTRIQL